MKLTRRRKIVLIVLLALISIGCVALFVPFGVALKDAEQIKVGMTLAEVEQILGTNPVESRVNGNDVIKSWQCWDGLIYVILINETVDTVAIRDYTRWNRLTDTVRIKLSLNPRKAPPPVVITYKPTPSRRKS